MEPEAIMQKVAKASGANYSFHKESNKFRDAGPQGPVVRTKYIILSFWKLKSEHFSYALSWFHQMLSVCRYVLYRQVALLGKLLSGQIYSHS